MRTSRVQARLRKARDFLKGMSMHEPRQDPDLRYSCALLAVHSAIAYGDALGEGLDTNYTASPDHKTLASRIEKLLSQRSYDKRQGIGHLRNLLKKKSSVAYTADTMTLEEVKAMMVSANRFSTWVNTTGSELNIEGWRDE